jgi:hypothetical protein
VRGTWMINQNIDGLVPHWAVCLLMSSQHVLQCSWVWWHLINIWGEYSLHACSPSVGVHTETKNFWGNITQMPEEKCHHQQCKLPPKFQTQGTHWFDLCPMQCNWRVQIQIIASPFTSVDNLSCISYPMCSWSTPLCCMTICHPSWCIEQTFLLNG